MTEDEALALLAGSEALSYDHLDAIFQAFRFEWSLEDGTVTWYWHKEYDVGEFRAEPRYDFSVLSPGQLRIVRRMIRRLIELRNLAKEND